MYVLWLLMKTVLLALSKSRFAFAIVVHDEDAEKGRVGTWRVLCKISISLSARLGAAMESIYTIPAQA